MIILGNLNKIKEIQNYNVIPNDTSDLAPSIEYLMKMLSTGFADIEIEA